MVQRCLGMMVHDTWYQYKGSWYYLGSDGAMLKGLQTINGKVVLPGSRRPHGNGSGNIDTGSGRRLTVSRPCKIENHTSDHRLYLAKFQHLIYDENIEKFCQNLRKNPLYALTIWSSTVDTEPAVRHSTGSIWAGVHRVLKGSCQRSHRLPGRCFQRYSCRRSIYGQRQWKR